MKYPRLVPDKLCKTKVYVEIISEEPNEDGVSEVLFEDNLNCNYQDGGKRIFTKEQQLIEVSGTALFNGDICERAANITSGYVTVHGIKRRIAEGKKHRNPDGTVNYTELRLI